MVTAILPLTFLGGNQTKTISISSVNSGAFVKTQSLTIRRKTRSRADPKLSIHAQYDDRSSGSGADFVAGFLLGGAVFGALAYIFSPQIRRSLLNENEHGFRRAKQPIYYDGDGGLERTRQTLEEKISQLNSAIDNASSRLRGGIKFPKVPVETDTEESAC
ncbi:hypothetical protein OROGR_025916 [Orobanche gracilis]